MTAASDILIAATDVDDRLLECLADCRATFARTFEEAQRALRECFFKVIVIDLNFDDVRMFDLLQHVRSLAAFSRVPILCVQSAEPAGGFGAALDRLVRALGGNAFVDLRGDHGAAAAAFERVHSVVGAQLGVQPAPRQSQRKEPAEAAREHRLCVLIIGHDVDAAQRLGELVEQRGHEVDFAYDAISGLDAARCLRPDVVFVDLALPQSDGYRIAPRLRRDRGSRDLRLVALVAAGDQEQLARVREARFDDHIVKPADRQSVHRLFVPRSLVQAPIPGQRPRR